MTNSLSMPWAIILIIPSNIYKTYRKLCMWCHNQIWYVLWWYWKTREAWRKKNKLHVKRLAFWSSKSSNENEETLLLTHLHRQEKPTVIMDDSAIKHQTVHLRCTAVIKNIVCPSLSPQHWRIKTCLLCKLDLRLLHW